MTKDKHISRSVCIECGTIQKYTRSHRNIGGEVTKVSCDKDECSVEIYNPRCPDTTDGLSIQHAGKQHHRYIVEDSNTETDTQQWYQVYKPGKKHKKTWYVQKATVCNCTFSDYHSACPHLSAAWRHINNHPNRETIFDSLPYDPA